MEEKPPETRRPAPRRPGPVDGIACHRMCDGLEVDPDLVRPAGDEVELEERPVREPLADPRPSGTTAIFVRCLGSRPIGASIRPTAAETLPCTRA
jgi:hypothetical protein